MGPTPDSGEVAARPSARVVTFPAAAWYFPRADPSLIREREPCNDTFIVAATSIAASTTFLGACAQERSPATAATGRRRSQAGRPAGRRSGQVPDPAAGHRDLLRRPVGARVQRQDLRLSLARLRLGHSERRPRQPVRHEGLPGVVDGQHRWGGHGSTRSRSTSGRAVGQREDVGAGCAPRRTASTTCTSR